MDNTKRFDGKGELYAKARPKYSEKLFEYLDIKEGSVVADIGSGTGIFSKPLLERGCRVFAVEPNADMRKKAEEKLRTFEKFISVDGTSSQTKLEDDSVDFVTAAQAFHWFDKDAFMKECKRILKPHGKIIIVYNSREPDAECTKALAELRREFNPEFHGFSNGMSEEKCLEFFENECDIFKIENNQTYDRQGYINRVLSSSYSLKEDDERFEKYFQGIENIFNNFSVDGKITVPTYTVAYIGEIV